MPVKKQRVRVEVNEIPVEKPKDGMGDAYEEENGMGRLLHGWDEFLDDAGGGDDDVMILSNFS